jgi:hypothetical protein
MIYECLSFKNLELSICLNFRASYLGFITPERNV